MVRRGGLRRPSATIALRLPHGGSCAMVHLFPRRSASSLLLLLLVFILAWALPLPAAAKRPLTPEDLWAMERVGEPSVSPDGHWVAFALTRYSVAENKGDSDLWLVPADGSAP